MTEHELVCNRMDRHSTSCMINHIVVCLLIGFIAFIVLREIDTLGKKIDAIQGQENVEEKK